MLNDFISDVCEILGIDPPEVSNDTSNFSTNTMMAQCDQSGQIIYIKHSEKATPDLFFSIAHELRHVWQIKKDKQLYFYDYKPIKK